MTNNHMEEQLKLLLSKHGLMLIEQAENCRGMMWDILGPQSPSKTRALAYLLTKPFLKKLALLPNQIDKQTQQSLLIELQTVYQSTEGAKLLAQASVSPEWLLNTWLGALNKTLVSSEKIENQPTKRPKTNTTTRLLLASGLLALILTGSWFALDRKKHQNALEAYEKAWPAYRSKCENQAIFSKECHENYQQTHQAIHTWEQLDSSNPKIKQAYYDLNEWRQRIQAEQYKQICSKKNIFSNECQKNSDTVLESIDILDKFILKEKNKTLKLDFIKHNVSIMADSLYINCSGNSALSDTCQSIYNNFKINNERLNQKNIFFRDMLVGLIYFETKIILLLKNKNNQSNENINKLIKENNYISNYFIKNKLEYKKILDTKEFNNEKDVLINNISWVGHFSKMSVTKSDCNLILSLIEQIDAQRYNNEFKNFCS